MADLRNIIRELAKPDGENVALVCTVDAVDEKSRTIDCTPLNEGAPLLGVNLQANQGADYGLWVIPEVGSFVVVGFVADGAAGVVLSTEKIKQAEIVIGKSSALLDKDGLKVNADKITFNGGKLGGLIKIKELTKKLNNIEDDINTLKTSISSWTPAAQDGGAALLAALGNWPTETLTKSQKSDYEDDNITH